MLGPKIRFALVVGVVLISISACRRVADVNVEKQAVASASLTIERVAPGVWIHTSWRELPSGGRFPANGLIVRHGDELILVDTAWGADITAELLNWIAAEIRLPVAKTIVSHFHDDSMGGVGVLAANRIPFAANARTVALGSGSGLPAPAVIAGLAERDVAMVGNLEVFYPGPAHSEDNLVVWVPEAKLLFGGCAVRSTAFTGLGNTADGDLENWPVAIGLVKERYPNARIVVPGHGPPGDVSLLTHTIQLFQE